MVRAMDARWLTNNDDIHDGCAGFAQPPRDIAPVENIVVSNNTLLISMFYSTSRQMRMNKTRRRKVIVRYVPYPRCLQGILAMIPLVSFWVLGSPWRRIDWWERESSQGISDFAKYSWSLAARSINIRRGRGLSFSIIFSIDEWFDHVPVLETSTIVARFL